MSNELLSASLIALVLITCTTVRRTCAQPKKSYDVIYSWNQIDFQFDSPQQREEYLENRTFIPENNAITGIKVSGDRVFLTVPRWRPGVPATLTYVPYNRSIGPQPTQAPSLIPYPSWEFNQEGNCSVIQYVQSMEIDPFNRMWVVDVGRRDIFEAEPDNTCPPKLVLLDLKTDQVVHSHVFPAEVVGRNSSFLNDLVLGCTSPGDCVAYISDARDGKIVIYDLSSDRSWFVQHPSMEADPSALVINIEGKNYTFETAVDGIALSNRDSNFSTIYFSPLSSLNVFSITSETARRAGISNEAGVQLKDSEVTLVGKKESQTDGMTMDANGVLYYGLLGMSGIIGWNTTEGRMTDANQVLVAQNDDELQWPDTFSIDKDGYLFATPNRLHRFFTNTSNFTEINFRVVRIFINSKSYMYSKKELS